MGQKVNPIGFRIGFNKSWDSLWYAEGKVYVDYLHQDLKIRERVASLLSSAGIARIKIERLSKKVKITIFASRPAVIANKKVVELQNLKIFIEKLTSSAVSIDIVEVKRPDANAVLVANNIAVQISNRISYKKAMKRAIQMAMKANVKGIKICVSGRLGGAEIARAEWYKEGRVPLHTLRSDIEYATASAHTTYGLIGVKVWLYLGDKSHIDY